MAGWLSGGNPADSSSWSRSGDTELTKDADTLRKYQDTLAGAVQRQTGRVPRPPDLRGSDLPARGRDPIPTPSGPALELR